MLRWVDHEKSFKTSGPDLNHVKQEGVCQIKVYLILYYITWSNSYQKDLEQ